MNAPATDFDMDIFENTTLQYTFLNETRIATVKQDTPGKCRSHAENDRLVISITGYVELVVCVVGAPANLLVLCLTVLFLIDSRRKCRNAPFGRRHQSNLWFVFSMTLSDTFFTCVHAPMMFALYAFDACYGTGSCLFLYIVTNTSTICSSLSLLWLNVDKFLYLNQPLHYHTRVTSKRALGAVIATWATSIVWALFFMLGPFTKYTPPCDFRPLHVNVYMAFAVCFFVLPTLVSVVVSVYVACTVARVSRENARRRRSCASYNVHRPSAVSTRSGEFGAQAFSAKAIAFVFTTTLWSAFTYLPYRFAYLAYITPGVQMKPWMVQLAYLLFALMAMNAAGNAFITIITHRQYSTTVSALLHGRRRLFGNSVVTETSIYMSEHRRISNTQSNTAMTPFSCSMTSMKQYRNGVHRKDESRLEGDGLEMTDRLRVVRVSV